MSPKVSVVMPVFNGAAYLGAAIESILAQTFDDFEFIIIDDGSIDDSAAVIRRFNDPRIRFFQQANKGLAATLNRGITLASGEYVARQDQDDLSLPARFEKQAAFLGATPRCALVGTRAEIWEGDKRTARAHDHPAENYILKFELLFDNPFVHSSVMLRKTALDKVGVYTTDPARQPPEDYELWSRLAREFDVSNIPERLLIYREFPSSMSRDANNPFLNKVIRISAENIALCLGESVPDQDITRLAGLVHYQFAGISEKPDFSKMEGMLLKAAARLAANSEQLRILQRKAVSILRGIRLQFFRRGPLWDLLRAIKARIRRVLSKVKI